MHVVVSSGVCCGFVHGELVAPFLFAGNQFYSQGGRLISEAHASWFAPSTLDSLYFKVIA